MNILVDSFVVHTYAFLFLMYLGVHTRLVIEHFVFNFSLKLKILQNSCTSFSLLSVVYESSSYSTSFQYLDLFAFVFTHYDCCLVVFNCGLT